MNKLEKAPGAKPGLPFVVPTRPTPLDSEPELPRWGFQDWIKSMTYPVITVFGLVLLAILLLQLFPPRGSTEPAMAWAWDSYTEAFVPVETRSPDPAPCPTCEYDKLSDMAKSIAHTFDSVSPKEFHEIIDHAWTESRYNFQAVSPTGSCGWCQGNPEKQDLTCLRMRYEPKYAASKCVMLYRKYSKVCPGSNWRCCYVWGKSGCKARQARLKLAIRR